jgi:hypothetical protein
MFSAIRKQITPATVLAFVALVFAVTGGAFAAGSHGGGSGPRAIASTGRAASGVPLASVAKSKAKGKAKAPARGPAGPKGATGAAGPAGATGATGATGPAGAAGGKGETGATGPAGPAGPEGKEGKEGPKGTTGYTKTLPAGETETGQWFLSTTAAGGPEIVAATAISFPIPLLERPATDQTGKAALYIGPEEGESELHESKIIKEHEGCAGTAAAPVAEPGHLCLFAVEAENLYADVSAAVAVFDASSAGIETETFGKTGAGIRVVSAAAGPVSIRGSWAVTAEE